MFYLEVKSVSVWSSIQLIQDSLLWRSVHTFDFSLVTVLGIYRKSLSYSYESWPFQLKVNTRKINALSQLNISLEQVPLTGYLFDQVLCFIADLKPSLTLSLAFLS